MIRKDPLTVIALDKLQLNEGQLDWLPKNPRSFTQTDLDRTKRSLDEDADFLQERPLLAVPGPDKTLVVFAGNLRLTAARALGWPGAPVVVYHPEDQIDRETILRRALKDNGSFGSWDPDTLANDWNTDPWLLEQWGVPDWITGGAGKAQQDAQRAMENGGLSSDGKEMGEGYGEFVDKFKPKLTTDDCYTPPAVYDVVRDFVNNKITPLEGRKIIRPFFPGGDYERLDQYPEGCVVIDNPPFSIFSKILRFYHQNKIQFFIFGPHLTLFSAPEIHELTYLPVCAPVEYENGAVVSTGFVTNMTPGLKIWIPAGFRHAIREIQRDTDPVDEYLIPPCVITSARLGVIAGVKGCELKITADECAYVRNLDAMEEQGKGLYGGGYLISNDRATYIEKEKEKEKEKRIHTFHLSEREQEIQAKLN